MTKVFGRMMEELNDLYIEKIRQVEVAMRAGNAGKVGNIFTQYQRDRQRIIDIHMNGKEN